MNIAILITVFLTVVLLSLALLNELFSTRFAVMNRLEVFTRKTGPKTFDEEKLSASFKERVVKPVVEKLSEKLTSLVPTNKSVGLQKKLSMAGNPGGFGPGEFMLAQYGLLGGLALLVVLIGLSAGWEPGSIFFGAVLAAFGGFVIPNFALSSITKGRIKEIQQTLPDVLDLLTVSVEAGLGFDAALVKVVDKTKGVLADLFNRMLQEIKMGKPRRDALKDMAHSTGNEDLASFVSSLVQADQLGISIGNVLRLQSEQMRGKRRQIAEEKAMKAPIKMLIPMILFIFPTMFIVLLGPAMIELVNTINK
ncbi:MAG TPA: type II secretion system F family protein [Bacillota bacterium]|nr:type II secretion system F family protein [Bacillota bacterium]